jgi:DNA-binding MarR family transcriptional regulator
MMTRNRLTALERQVLEIVATRPGIGAKEIKAVVGRTVASVANAIDVLERHGLIDRGDPPLTATEHGRMFCGLPSS